MPTEFVFIRHAEGTHNKDGKIRGDIAYHDPIHIDANLTEYGIEQALSKNLGYETFDQVYCSPMRRCKQTLLNMYPISEVLQVIVDDRLIEQPQGHHLCNKRLEKNDPESMVPLRWNTKLVSKKNPYIKDVDKDINNILSFTKEIINKYPDGKILVVTHGRWINNWSMIYKNKSRWVDNCEIVREKI